MVLDDLGERDDGTSGVPPMCFSMPTSQPSILSWHALGSRAGAARARARRGHHHLLACFHLVLEEQIQYQYLNRPLVQ